MTATTRVIALADVPDEIAEAVQPVIRMWEVAAISVATDLHKKHAPGSVESLLAEQLVTRSDVTQKLAAARSEAILHQTKFPRRIERQLAVSPTSPTSSVSPTSFKFPPDLKSRLEKLAHSLAAKQPSPSGGSETTYDFVRLNLRSLRCVDETNGFLGSEAGSDEISIGGTLVDSDGNTGKVGPIDLGGNWDDGTVRRFNPGKQLLRYSLKGGRGFPQAVFVTLVLAERDGAGDFQRFVDAATDKIAEQAKASLAAALGAAAGSAGGPLGTLIGLAVGYAVGKIVDKIKAAWADDLFTAVTIELQIPSRQTTFGGSTPTKSRVVNMVFSGPGEYRAHYQWDLIDEQ
jgi:hypothetical protein